MKSQTKSIENIGLGATLLVVLLLILTAAPLHRNSVASNPSRLKDYRDLATLRTDSAAAVVVRMVGKPFDRKTGEATLTFARFRVNKVVFGQLSRNDEIDTVLPLEPASNTALTSGKRTLILLTRYEVVRGQPRSEWVVVGDGAGVFASRSDGDEADTNDGIEEEFSKTDSKSSAFPAALFAKGTDLSQNRKSAR
jgi:hypothetical protein